MKIIKKKISEIKNLVEPGKFAMVTVGFFDGFHKYHNDILKTAQETAKQNGWLFIVVSFNHKVASFLQGIDDQVIGNEAKEKYLAQNFDIDYFVELQVDDHLINTSPSKFIHWLVRDLNTIAMVEGEDFRFGAQGTGTVRDLQKEFDPKNIIIKKRIKGFSTNLIKQLIGKGKIKKANKMLGLPFTLNVKLIPKEYDVYQIIFPHFPLKFGYYEAIINERISAKIFINEQNILKIIMLNGVLEHEIFSIAPIKYLGKKVYK